MGKDSRKRLKPYADPAEQFADRADHGAPGARDQARPRSHPPNTKPGRRKAQRAQSRSYNIPSVPRTPDGAPQLPLTAGLTTVHALGRVCCENKFHTDRWIFPVGYEITRRYLSMHNADADALYTCVILHAEDVDGGQGPRFRITPSDDAANPITSKSATVVWSVVVEAANKIRNRKHPKISGPDYFGLGQNIIKYLLQELEGADRLQGYVHQHFIEGGPFRAVTTEIKPGLGGSGIDASGSGVGGSGAGGSGAAVKVEDVAVKVEDVAMKVEDEGDSGDADYVPKSES